jgi:hypothetical protein
MYASVSGFDGRLNKTSVGPSSMSSPSMKNAVLSLILSCLMHVVRDDHKCVLRGQFADEALRSCMC